MTFYWCWTMGWIFQCFHLAVRLSCSAMKSLDSGRPNWAARAMRIGTMPLNENRIRDPYCGTNTAVTKPGMAPPSGTQPTAMIASVARSLRGAYFARCMATSLEMTPLIIQARQEPQRQHLIEISRVCGCECNDAEQQASTRTAQPYDHSGRRPIRTVPEPNRMPIRLALNTRAEPLLAKTPQAFTKCGSRGRTTVAMSQPSMRTIKN